MTEQRKPRLSRPLTLERPVHTPDGGGGHGAAWHPVATLWAEVRGLRPVVEDLGGAVESRVSHRIVLRAVPEGSPLRPDTGHRLRESGRVYQIRGVVEEPGGAFLTVWAEAAEHGS